IIGCVRPIADTPVEVFDDVVRVNLRGVWLGLSRLLAVMPRGAAITVTSSTGGLRGVAGMAPYSATKHAVIGLVKSAALEVANRGIRVNAVHPGGIDTPMLADIGEQKRLGTVHTVPIAAPLGEVGRPEDVAATVAWLSSDQAAYCTGASFVIDGGA